ncbi:cobalt-precorrin-6A reductase [Pseudonocardia sp. KRD291]|uniref:cobalt-precorrin-6A reductase n=1 Tax=Pseudonocardia sp. KRD291 TaxID=2792007 RepID=UPI001C5C5828|nr:cobalt-precorrin-6A reductase [Pseudonocardia sp. KRD291]MBW0102785.1 cobalt-precorrin-6A reductase [Pseudonocardia sp. KRD291]
MTVVLVLGGTTEGRAVAAALDGRPGLRVVSSLAGRVADPALPSGQVRIGGFGGAAGLTRWLRAERVDVVVDATHPFAAGMTANAALACRDAGVELVVLRRPGWSAGPGDRWHRVPDAAGAAALAPTLGDRVFLTTGRGDLAAFAGVDAAFLIRSVDPPDPPLPREHRVLLDRGPFTLDGELAVMRDFAAEVLVTKNSGGAATEAKLTAARMLDVPVVMIDRPPLPDGVTPATSVTGVLNRLGALGHDHRPGSGTHRT